MGMLLADVLISFLVLFIFFLFFFLSFFLFAEEETEAREAALLRTHLAVKPSLEVSAAQPSCSAGPLENCPSLMCTFFLKSSGC